MSVTDIATRRDMTDAERRAAARRDVLADPSVTGAVLGERYGRTAAWGRKLKRNVLEEMRRNAAPDRDADATPAVTVPVPRHDPPSESRDEAVPRDISRWVHTVTVLAVLIVAGVAAVLSYAHMRHLGVEAGEGWRANLIPISVDGMMVVASMTALAKRRQGKAAPVAWLGLALGVTASLAANVAAAEPTLVGRLLAAWPPLALVLAFELLLEQGRDQ